MDPQHTVPELIAAAQASAEAIKDKIAKLPEHPDGSETAALEAIAVDMFTLFESRMQHHFRRGPFSRKLAASLKQAGRTTLANQVHQYYLAINVLKHGTGASYRELRDMPNAMFPVKPADTSSSQDGVAPSGLIDVDTPEFFEGLATTLLEAHQFLETQ